MINKITTAAALITTASTVYLAVRVNVLETRIDKSAAIAVEKLERDLFSRLDAAARARQHAYQEAERNQRAAISKDLQSIPDVLMEGR